MNRLLQNRLGLQLLFTFLAAVSVAALSIILVSEAVRGAESVLLKDTNRTLASAVHELMQQYRDRASFDSSWSTLPAAAQDVSLRGITQTVLRSYQGVEGGFYAGSEFLGYAYPTHDTGLSKTDVPSAERGLILALVKQSLGVDHAVQQVVRGKSDLLVIEARANHQVVVWAMKRLVGRAAPGIAQREVMLAGLGLAALISVVGTLATGLSLARGVAQIQLGLSTLERNFDYRLPERQDEFGGISKSINRMAAVRKKLESELRREDRLRALGRLAAGLAHEIRNPLNSIGLTVQLMERRLSGNSIRKEDLQLVRSEVDRLSSLLNDLLDLQRVRVPSPQLQSVTPVVRHCVELIERQAEMQHRGIRFRSPEAEIRAVFDARQLTQAVMNLLLNGLEAPAEEEGGVEVSVMERDGAVHIEVENAGNGLSAEQQEYLFEPFYTTKATGTGLGLAVSRELMRSQGGNLSYVPRESGACFVIELPKG